MAHIEYEPTPAALEFQQIMEAALLTISDNRSEFSTTCKATAAATWEIHDQDVYQQAAANPKIATHTRPMVNDGGGRCLNPLICNAGEYMAGAKKDALTVPDRSLPHLRHPTWYAGRAVCDTFKKPSLELMGPRHPVKDHIKTHVQKTEKAVAAYGPLIGPKGAKERLEWHEASELKVRNGRGEMPKWMAASRYNKPFNPVSLHSGNYILEKHREKATRPAKCNPHLPQVKLLYKPGLLEKDLKLVNLVVKEQKNPGWPEGDKVDYMALRNKTRPNRCISAPAGTVA